MKVLFLVQAEQRAILDRLYDGVAAHCDCDLRWLNDEQQADLRRYFREHVDLSRYDRVLTFLRFKKEMRQANFLSTVPNLVVLEHDAYQNYIPCKYTGKFSAHYRRMPWVRIISSGCGVTRHLCEEGFDAVFVPKGYDQTLLRDLGVPRDIELGFLGSTKSGAYSARKALLEELGRLEPLTVTRTNSGEEYLGALNRIRFFVSADIGMGEYMIKNFEAMACGCVLFAYDHGVEESRAVGFIDMENVVLYRTVAELREKLDRLRAEPGLAGQIAVAGRDLAQARFGFNVIGRQVVEALQPALRAPERAGWISKIRLRLGL